MTWQCYYYLFLKVRVCRWYEWKRAHFSRFRANRKMKFSFENEVLRVWKCLKFSKRPKPGIMKMGRQRLGCIFVNWFSEHILSGMQSHQIVGNILWCIQNIITTVEKGSIKMKVPASFLAIVIDQNFSWSIYSNSPLKALSQNYRVKIMNREPLCPNDI